MRLNTIKPAEGAKRARIRVGRGIGSGFGKTAGRGHKGQRARKGGRGKVGFEGGQMPIQRRLPKRGFRSAKAALSAEVRLSDIEKLTETEIDLKVLKRTGLVPLLTQQAKIINTGGLSRKVELRGLAVTKGARDAIAAVGGSIQG